jgi:hypothetical protein
MIFGVDLHSIMQNAFNYIPCFTANYEHNFRIAMAKQVRGYAQPIKPPAYKRVNRQTWKLFCSALFGFALHI